MIYIYILTFVCWIIINYSKNKFNTSTYILSLYLFSMCCCELLFLFYPESIRYPERISFLSVFIHLLLLWLYLRPVLYIGNHFKIENLRVNYKALNIFAWFIIIPSLISIVLSFSSFIDTIYSKDILAARTLVLENNEASFQTKKHGLLGYTIAWGEYSILLSVTLAFYYIFYLKKKNKTSILLLISSFAGVISNISLTGRASIIKWGLSAIFAIVLMRKYISFRENKKMFISMGCLFVGIMLIFFIISSDRFSDLGFSLLSYIGQEYYYFSYGFERFADDPYSSIGAIFPIFSGNIENSMNLNMRVSADYFLNTFPTFAGSILNKIGIWNALFLFATVFIIIFLCFYTRKRHPKYTLTQFIGYIYLYEVALYGLFYFYHGERFSQALILIYLAVSYFLSKYYLASINKIPSR